MSREKRITEELGIVKVVLGLVIVLDASVVAWFVQNLGGTEGWRLSLAVMAAAILTFVFGRARALGLAAAESAGGGMMEVVAFVLVLAFLGVLGTFSVLGYREAGKRR